MADESAMTFTIDWTTVDVEVPSGSLAAPGLSVRVSVSAGVTRLWIDTFNKMAAGRTREARGQTWGTIKCSNNQIEVSGVARDTDHEALRDYLDAIAQATNATVAAAEAAAQPQREKMRAERESTEAAAAELRRKLRGE